MKVKRFISRHKRTIKRAVIIGVPVVVIGGIAIGCKTGKIPYKEISQAVVKTGKGALKGVKRGVQKGSKQVNLGSTNSKAKPTAVKPEVSTPNKPNIQSDMKTIYSTNEYKGHGKQNYFHNEYRTNGDVVEKVRCQRQKFFNGHENNWETSRRVIDSWKTDDPNLPEWLKNKIVS